MVEKTTSNILDSWGHMVMKEPMNPSLMGHKGYVWHTCLLVFWIDIRLWEGVADGEWRCGVCFHFVKTNQSCLWSRPLLNYLIKTRNDERKWVRRWWWLRVHKPRLESLIRDVPFSYRSQVACREVAVGDLDYWSWLASPVTCCTWVRDPADDFVQSWLFSEKFQFLQ
jgi:hypothetical protein